MRPYLAVIKDSFREALASRTLQVLLILVLLLLLVLAIPGFRVERPWQLAPGDVISPETLVAKLGRNAPGSVSKAESVLKDKLPDDVRQKIAAYRADASAANLKTATEALVAALNGLVEGPNLYDADGWKDVNITREGQQLLAEGWDELSTDERRRFNRLLVDGALSGQVTAAANPQAYLTYVTGEVEIDVPAEAMRSVIKSIVYVLLKWFVGAIGILAAIIFTANTIPQMFEPGAIDLLLSKPVSRSALFLARFAGGCAFILLNAALLICGLWLILWLRHDVWQPRILLSIPVFLLAFAIYFSISAYVGVKWRNPILAIALALVAWVGTFSLHQVWFWGEQANLNGQRAEVLLDLGGVPLVARKNGEVVEWSGDRWQPIFEDVGGDPNQAIQRGTGQFYPMIGPALAGTQDDPRIVAAEALIFPQAGFSQIGKLVDGHKSDGWQRKEGLNAPGDIERLLVDAQGQVLIATRSGIQAFPDQLSSTPPIPTEVGLDGGLLQRITGDGAAKLGPEGAVWPDPFDATLDLASGKIVIYARGRLLVLRRGETGFEVAIEKTTEHVEAALVAVAGEAVYLALADGTIEQYALATLEPAGVVGSLEAMPRLLSAAPDGKRLFALDHQRRLHLIDPQAKSIERPGVRGQGGVNAAAWRKDGSLLVADRYPRVVAYDAAGDVLDSWEHNEGFTWVFVWVINPLRTILPKPDELDFLVREVTGASEDEQQLATDDLSREREYVDLWTPLWTNALFVAVVLGWTCWLIERRDY